MAEGSMLVATSPRLKEVPMQRLWLVFVSICFAASAAAAQTKISGTEQCPKPESQQMIPVGDRADHTLVVTQSKCSWTKPIEIEGVQVKESVNTSTMDATGKTGRTRGYDIGTMANGDKYYARYQGTSVLKDGAVQSSEGTWSFFGGTGKLKGIKGKGTWKCKGTAEGSICEIEGEYEPAK